MEHTNESAREVIKTKLRQTFDGKIVRKDLTKKIKEGANVPVYVLEFLLGQYCCSDEDEIIEKGVQNVKRILADNFVRPDEAQKILAKLRSNGNNVFKTSSRKRNLSAKLCGNIYYLLNTVDV
jgi:ATP-dependent Lon protease